MHRIDHPTAVVAQPAPGAPGTPGYFTEGDPVGGVPATVVTQAWANAVQEEILGVIEAAGLTPDKADNAQLLAAIQALINAGATVGFPIGGVLPFAGPVENIPDGYLLCDFSTVSRTTYAELFAAIGTTYGVGDGTTTFNLPDLRGEFIRGLDNGRGVDAGRTLGTAQQDAQQNITGSAAINGAGLPRSASDVTGAFSLDSATANAATSTSNSGYKLKFDASLVARTADETRPRNVAMNFIIKYQ